MLLDVAYAGSLGRDLAVNQQLSATPLLFVRAAQAFAGRLAQQAKILNQQITLAYQWAYHHSLTANQLQGQAPSSSSKMRWCVSG